MMVSIAFADLPIGGSHQGTLRREAGLVMVAIDTLVLIGCTERALPTGRPLTLRTADESGSLS